MPWGGSSVFSPTTLGGLKTWLRGDQGVTIATGVSTWADQSGNGNNATQPTAASQPSYSNPYVNSDAIHALQFDGPLLTGGLTLVFDFAYTSLPSSRESMFSIVQASGTRTYFEVISEQTTGKINFVGKEGTGSTTTFASSFTWDTNPHWVVLAYTGGTNTDVAQYGMWVDGVAQTLASFSTVSRPNGTDLGSIFGRITAANGIGSVAPMKMKELLLYNRVLSSSEVAQLNSYMASNAP